MNYSQLTKKQQIQNSLIYMFPAGLSSLLPFISIPIMTRILTPEDYGLLALAMIYAIFMCGLSNFGVSFAFERNYFQYRDDPKKNAQLLFSSLVFVITNFVFLAGLTYIFRDYISVLLTGSKEYGIFILTAFAGNFFLNTASIFFFCYFKNEQNAKAYTKYRVISSIISFSLSLFLVAYIKIGVIGIVVSQLITGVLVFLFLLYMFLIELRFSLNKRILFESLKISYPLTPRLFIGVISTQFDKYMISLLASIGGVGVYHIGKKLSELIFTFMTAIENVFNPQVYQLMFGKHIQGSKSIGKYLTPFLYISIIIALCIALFSEELIIVLTPNSYHGAIPIVIILSIHFGFMFFGKIVPMQLIYLKKTKIISLLTIFGVVLNVFLNIPLIMKWGIIGAACATLLAGLISGIVSLIVAQHFYKINYEWGKISWIMGTFFTGLITIVSMHLLGFPYLWSLTIKITTMAFYIYLGVKYGIVSKDNFRELKAAIRLRSIVTT